MHKKTLRSVGILLIVIGILQLRNFSIWPLDFVLPVLVLVAGVLVLLHRG